MSSNTEHVDESKDSAPQDPDGGDNQDGESGGPATGDGHDAEEGVRTPLQDTSCSSSNTPEAVDENKGKRKSLEVEDSMTLGDSGAAPVNPRKRARKRLSLEQKTEILNLLQNGTKHAEIAQRYACSKRVVSTVAENKGKLELKKKSPGFNGKAKSEKTANFPQLDEKVMKMVEDARRYRVPVTRVVISSFGLAVKTQMLSSGEMSEAQQKRLEDFSASVKWSKNFVRRQGLVSKVLRGCPGGDDRGALQEGLDALREAARHCAANDVFKAEDEAEFFYKVVPRRTYLTDFEGQKAGRGTKHKEEQGRDSVEKSGVGKGEGAPDGAMRAAEYWLKLEKRPDVGDEKLEKRPDVGEEKLEKRPDVGEEKLEKRPDVGEES